MWNEIRLLTFAKQIFHSEAISLGRCQISLAEGEFRWKKTNSYELVIFSGWGTGIRTPVMTESESVALPLGDAPIFSTLHIIAEKKSFVNTYFQLFLKNLFFFWKKSFLGLQFNKFVVQYLGNWITTRGSAG